MEAQEGIERELWWPGGELGADFGPGHPERYGRDGLVREATEDKLARRELSGVFHLELLSIKRVMGIVDE